MSPLIVQVLTKGRIREGDGDDLVLPPIAIVCVVALSVVAAQSLASSTALRAPYFGRS